MIATKKLLQIGMLALAIFAVRQSAVAQLQDLSGVSINKLKRMSSNAERYGDAYTALHYYSPFAQKKSENAKVQFQLAQLHEKVRDYPAAAEVYRRAFELDESNPEALYRQANMLKMSGKVEDAKVQFELLSSLIRPNNYDKEWRRSTRDAIASCDTALALLSNVLPVEVVNMGDGVNGPHAEFAPIPYGDDKLIFGSIRESEVRHFHVDSMSTRRRLYMTERVADVWLTAEPWDEPFNRGDAHVVNGAFTADGNTFVFTKCTENWKKEMACALWLVCKEGKGWSEPEMLDESINVPGAIVTQPTFGVDPRKGYDVMYYSSNQAEGQGGMDIWFTYYDSRKKEWRKPRNMGRKINGPFDEVTPYYQLKEKKLYYSSASLPGLGGLDVFAARGEMQKFAPPQNVGYPVNSHADDLYYVLLDDRESGYLVSNRKGGYQMMNETCCDDLYSFFIPDVIHLAMEGFVMQVNEEDYISGGADKLSTKSFNADFLEGVTVDLFILEDSVEVLMNRSTTGAEGTYFVEFEPEKQYKVVLSRPGYYSNHVNVDTRGMAKSDTLVQNVGLSKRGEGAIVVENILFEFDSSELTEESKAQIEKGILRTLIENPEIIVELGAHTDNKGADDYNKRLSQQRAESVVNYISGRGISAQRLKAKGYGAEQPIAPNKLPDGSDNPEGRALNRRTEFKIVGELQIPDEEEE